MENTLRETLKKNPALTLCIVGALAAAAMAFGIHSFTSGGSAVVIPGTYYTCDDGKTVFEDNDSHNVPPFQHDGQEAVQVFFIPGKTAGRTDSIWYLSKMTDEHKKQLEAMAANGPGAMPGPAPKAGPGGTAKMPSPFGGQLIKRPGDAEWVPMGDPKSAEILKIPG